MRWLILFCAVFAVSFYFAYTPKRCEWPNNLSDEQLEELEKEWDQQDLQIRLWYV